MKVLKGPVKILDIEGLKIKSVNEKYGYNPKIKRLYLTEEYKQFKNLIALAVLKKRFKPPYRVIIKMETAMDIDNPVKAILDGLETAGVIENDGKVYELILIKKPVKRGGQNRLKIYIETIKP